MSSQHQEGYYQMEDGRWKITANHKIRAVTPKMIDWWWDHIDTTERYQWWHPTDHVSFEWVVPPANGHIGAVHRVQEFFNGTPESPLSLEIRWEDPVQANAEYAHVLLATGTGAGGALNATLMHEYEETSDGARMRSHFWLSAQAPEAAVEALYQHNRQEMAFLSMFLPKLYRDEVELPERLDTGYFVLGNKRITKVLMPNTAPQYFLWENWADQKCHMTASSPSMLIEIERIDIREWSWYLSDGSREGTQ